MTKNNLSLTQKILCSAMALDTPFSAEALIVAAWQANPESFGLKGYEQQHPNANTVLSHLSHQCGPVKRGWLCRTGPKRYMVTALGKAEFLALTSPVAGKKLPAHLDRFVTVLLSSEVYRKFEAGKKQDISFADACNWWRLGKVGGLTRDAVKQFLGEITSAFREIEVLLDDGPVRLRCDRDFSAADQRELANIDGWLREAKRHPLKLLGGA